MIKNKRAWLRIFEAFLAIIIIAITAFFIYGYLRPDDLGGEEIYRLETTILSEVAENFNFRGIIVGYDADTDLTPIEVFVARRVPSEWGFEIKVCEVNLVCGMGEYKEEVYATERIVSSNLTDYSPKKLKIFIWEE